MKYEVNWSSDDVMKWDAFFVIIWDLRENNLVAETCKKKNPQRWTHFHKFDNKN